MFIETLIAILFFMLLVTISYLLRFLGLFHPVDAKVGPPPVDINGQEVFYKLHRGAYSKSGHEFTQLIGDLGRISTGALPEKFSTIGFYYDDPALTSEAKCRYAVGVI